MHGQAQCQSSVWVIKGKTVLLDGGTWRFWRLVYGTERMHPTTEPIHFFWESHWSWCGWVVVGVCIMMNWLDWRMHAKVDSMLDGCNHSEWVNKPMQFSFAWTTGYTPAIERVDLPHPTTRLSPTTHRTDDTWYREWTLLAPWMLILSAPQRNCSSMVRTRAHKLAAFELSPPPCVPVRACNVFTRQTE